MNDFLRQCNCVHPPEGQCEKCMEEATLREDPKAGSAGLQCQDRPVSEVQTVIVGTPA